MNSKWLEVIEEYYLHNEDTSLLEKKYQLSDISCLPKILPLYTHPINCEHCSTPLVSNFVDRTQQITNQPVHLDVTSRPCQQIESTCHFHPIEQQNIRSPEGYFISFPYCPGCAHRPTLNCQCSGCTSTKKSNRILAWYKYMEKSQANRIPPMIENFSLKTTFLCLFILDQLVRNPKAEIQQLISDEELNFLLNQNILVADSDSVFKAIKMLNTCEYTTHHSSISYHLSTHVKSNHSELLDRLKSHAKTMYLHTEKKSQIIEFWMKLCFSEASDLFKRYCLKYNFPVQMSRSMNTLIYRSIHQMGLAQTCRYIYSSLTYARWKGEQLNLPKEQTRNLAYKNIHDWLEHKKQNTRKSKKAFDNSCEFSSSTTEAQVFSRYFLEPHGLNYFSRPLL